MGSIKRYYCDCGYEMEFFAGAGMRAIDKSVAEQMFPKVFVEGKIEKVFLDHVLGECPQCKVLKTIVRMQYKKAGETKQNIAIKEFCMECNSIMKIHEDAERIQCPKCGCNMKYNLTGNWD